MPPLRNSQPITARLPDLQLTFGPFTAGWCSLAEIGDPARPALASLLEVEGALHADLDRKALAALVLGRVGFGVSHLLAAWALTEDRLPALTGRDLALLPERIRRVQPEGEEAIRYARRIAAEPAALQPCDAETLHALILALLTPLVVNIRTRAGLSPGASWRLIADMVCYGFLRAGEALERGKDARSLALAVIEQPGSPLHNGKSGFQFVEAAEGALRGAWFIRRGGCCRWYTAPGNDRCAVCVLRPVEEQQRILGAHLRDRVA